MAEALTGKPKSNISEKDFESEGVRAPWKHEMTNISWFQEARTP